MVNKEKIMQFDKEKVLTPFTAHRASKGDWGLVANDIAGMTSKTKAKNVEFVELRNVDVGSNYPFRAKDSCDIFSYFCPAPYEYMQARWVEEVGLKVGDKVRIVKKWEKGEGGFDCAMGFLQEVNLVGYVDSIEKDSIYVALHSGPYHTPYFALEKVEEAPTTHRPFADAEEFSMYERLTLRKGDDRFVVLSYNNTGVVIYSWREPENVYSNGDVVGRIVGGWESKHYPYKELLEEGFLFNSSQKPAGVKL